MGSEARCTPSQLIACSAIACTCVRRASSVTNPQSWQVRVQPPAPAFIARPRRANAESTAASNILSRRSSIVAVPFCQRLREQRRLRLVLLRVLDLRPGHRLAGADLRGERLPLGEQL